MPKCEQELCPFWSGSGCMCEAVDIGAPDRLLAKNASEGWASYAAEQERHAETRAVLEALPDAETLRWYATHEALSRHAIFDVLMALADIRQGSIDAE